MPKQEWLQEICLPDYEPYLERFLFNCYHHAVCKGTDNAAARALLFRVCVEAENNT